MRKKWLWLFILYRGKCWRISFLIWLHLQSIYLRVSNPFKICPYFKKKKKKKGISVKTRVESKKQEQNGKAL